MDSDGYWSKGIGSMMVLGKFSKLGCSLVMAAVLLAGCGGGSTCDTPLLGLDPSGQWRGTFTRQESDCGSSSLGATFQFDHQVSLACDGNGDSNVYVVNEDNIFFSQTSYSDFGGGSFTAQSKETDLTIDITYDDFGGNTAKVSEKIRRYAGGKIICSESFTTKATRVGE